MRVCEWYTKLEKIVYLRSFQCHFELDEVNEHNPSKSMSTKILSEDIIHYMSSTQPYGIPYEALHPK